MKKADLIARLSSINSIDRDKEIYVLARILGQSQRSIAAAYGISFQRVSQVLIDVDKQLDSISTYAESIDWRSTMTRLECDLADALTREKFLQDKIDRLLRRDFWRSELRVPNIREIRRSS